MAKEKSIKTNVMRILDQAGISYQHHHRDGAEHLSGAQLAALLEEDPDRVFKTLVTIGKSGAHYVFMIPVAEELDLKKAAAAVQEKSIAMLKSKDLLPTTGYNHGGCSPIGMKKPFPTTIHQTATLFPTILFSAGKIGHQVEIAPSDLFRLIACQSADLIVAK